MAQSDQVEEYELPFVYRLTEPFAKRKIKAMGFDRRKRETKIFELSIHRYYMDLIEVYLAIALLIGRVYLGIESEYPFGGSMPFNSVDAILLFFTAYTITKNQALIAHYKKNIVERIESISRK